MPRANDTSYECDQTGSDPAKTRLFHCTSEEAAVDILAIGFLPGDDGLVWFAEHPTKIWGARTMAVLLEVEVRPKDVQPFREVLEEEEWDSIGRQWVKANQTEGLVYFALPPDIANRFSPRLLTAEERHILMI